MNFNKKIIYMVFFLFILGISGCGGGASSDSTAGTGQFFINGQVLVPTGTNSPVKRLKASEYLTAATVSYSGKTATTDNFGRFKIDAASMNLGAHTLKITKNTMTLNYPIVARNNEHVIIKLQYDGGTQKNLVTETRLDFNTANKIKLQTVVKMHNALSENTISDIISTSASKEIPDTYSQSKIFDEIKALILLVENDAKDDDRLTGIIFSEDNTTILEDTDIQIKSLLKSLKLLPINQTIVVTGNKSISVTGVYSDKTEKSIVSGLSFTSSDTSVASVSSAGVITGVASGEAVITAIYNEISGTSAVKIINNPVSELMVSNVTPNSATISFLTSEDLQSKIEYGKTVALGSETTLGANSKIHVIVLSDLSTLTKYYYNISLTGTETIAIENIDIPFELMTSSAAELAMPRALGGQVKDKSANNLKDALVFVYTDTTYPLLGKTNDNGIFLVDLGNLKKKIDGKTETITNGMVFTIDVIHSDGVKKGNQYTIVNDVTPYETGIYTIE